ncbi:transcriptional regulator [Promethearchaeum syntrophicum]|uniref:Transcriptional regulator n=1 Tax=Promethearchaeum syntrophicum TaxID=2594042 RepID=A0A5B9DGJ1_9ARCH|nr:transcriptional regulator [Candidatus Prometheoarchaeum syntrophicum]QEE17863.1 hypothetical protein DSAG12_03701 [Candidatus Prometheoarchaeum syntrophicum]
MTTKNSDIKEKMDKIGGIDKIIHSTGRLKIISLLYGIEEADFVFIRGQTGLTWGNLSVQATKLEESGYIKIEKKYKRKKPLTIASLTKEGRLAFEKYRKQMQDVLNQD